MTIPVVEHASKGLQWWETNGKTKQKMENVIVKKSQHSVSPGRGSAAGAVGQSF